MTDDFLDRVVDWATARTDIVALIMTGSRARPEGHVDAYSDYDLEIFSSTPERYTSEDVWMKEIAGVWVYLPTESDLGYPTRLVIFADGRKVDFGIRPVSSLEEIVDRQELGGLYERGYRVLVNRTRLAGRLPTPSYSPPPGRLPKEAEFLAAVEEFWFEAWHIPKYILRGDLWVVKFRDWTMKELLLRMLEWNAAAHQPDVTIGEIGSGMKEWTGGEVWTRLDECFGRFDADDSRRALLATISLFRDVASDAAVRLGYRYPASLDAALSDYVSRALDSPE
jgi:aminoglycoside 6-adenylyltransferase